MSISRVYKIVNDVDDLVYIGSTKQILCKRMTNHRDEAKQGRGQRRLYRHMRELGFEHFRILLVREYKEISKERLRYKEDKYIKRFDTVRHGLNMHYAFSSKCEHDILRYSCKKCKGTGICHHNKEKRYCKECGGSHICPHNRRKEQCRECGGSVFCPHNKTKIKCKECKGSQVCSHGNQKARCKECGGTEVCPHKKIKQSCKVCSPMECTICLKIFAGRSNLNTHKRRMHPAEN